VLLSSSAAGVGSQSHRAAGENGILPRDYQAALDSDDASSGSSLRLLQMRAASSRQPAQSQYAQRIEEALAVVPKDLIASQRKGAPPGTSPWPAKAAPRPQQTHAENVGAGVNAATLARDRTLPWAVGAAAEPAADDTGDIVGGEADGETAASNAGVGNDPQSLPSPLVPATSAPTDANENREALESQATSGIPASPSAYSARVATEMPAVGELQSVFPDQDAGEDAMPVLKDLPLLVASSPVSLVVSASPAPFAAQESLTLPASAISESPSVPTVPAAQALPQMSQSHTPNASSPTSPPTAEFSPDSHKDEQVSPPQGSEYNHPAWLHTCTKIMLDLGTGRGDHVRMMYEPETFTMSNLLLMMQQIFHNPAKRQLPGSESGICVLGLEPNSQYQTLLEEMRQNYQARGWNVHFYPFAAWSSSGMKEFQFQNTQALGEGDMSPAGPTVSVRTVDMADFVNSLPPSIGVEMMIMDMDGAEYETLARLLEANVMCQSIIQTAVISAHAEGDARRWANPGVSSFIGKSFQGIKEQVGLQQCNGKSTRVMDLDSYGAPLSR